MRSLLEVLNLCTDFLKDKGIQNFRREAQDLISDALNLSRVQIYLEHDRPLTDGELTVLRERLQRRAKGEPGAYIHGSVKFLDSSIRVTPSVLIPRQETEILTDKVVQALKNENLAGKTLWDICCGSGCIGIAIKKALPALQVISSDISSEALEIARQNSRDNNVDIEFLKGDLLTPFHGRKADYLVCNPPYIAEQDWKTLEREVRDYEPLQALVSGHTGLEIYQRLANELELYLHPRGKAWFEIGAAQAEPIKNLFQRRPWKNFRPERDWAGKDRFFFLEIE
jgi:release factor glutamine methyltransferase